jgi:hypothetical protein
LFPQQIAANRRTYQQQALNCSSIMEMIEKQRLTVESTGIFGMAVEMFNSRSNDVEDLTKNHASRK